MKFPNAFEAYCYLIRAGFRWNEDYQRFDRNSFNAKVIIQKNGKAKTISY